MKFFSILVVLAQLVMFGSLVQATLPTGGILQYSTRELVEELQMRMILAKRTRGDIAGAGNSVPYHRSVSYDDFLEVITRGTPAGQPVADGGHDDTGSTADLTTGDSAGTSGTISTVAMHIGAGRTSSTAGGFKGGDPSRRSRLKDAGKNLLSKLPGASRLIKPKRL